MFLLELEIQFLRTKLLCLSAGYVIGGAYLFISIETPLESLDKQVICKNTSCARVNITEIILKAMMHDLTYINR